jgi:FkbM family methyltransferase
MTYRLAAQMVLPWTRREWKGSWRLIKSLGVAGPANDAAWQNVGERVVRGRWHGYRMIVDPSDWAQRLTYFTARYYDTKTQLALMRLLEPGDRFVDVGANQGMMSLLAARLVGDAGVVDAFEPHPECVDRIRRQLELNGIDHVRLHAVGLGETPGHADLHFKPNHAGYSTLAEIDDQQQGTRSVRVEVQRGDDALRRDPRPVSVIKIDVEGFEPPALRGLSDTLTRDRPAVITEINPHCLRQAGMTPSDVINALSEHEYVGQRLDCEGERLSLASLEDQWDRRETIDSLWLPRERAQARERLCAA